jgi:hypothetical protein
MRWRWHTRGDFLRGGRRRTLGDLQASDAAAQDLEDVNGSLIPSRIDG